MTMASVPPRCPRGRSPGSTTESTISLGSYHALIDEHDPRHATVLRREYANYGHKAPMGLLIPEETTARWPFPSEESPPTETVPYPQTSSHCRDEASLVKPEKRGRSQSVPDSCRPSKRPFWGPINPSMSQRLADRAAGYDEGHDADTQEFVASQRRGRVAAGLSGRPTSIPFHQDFIEVDIDTVIQTVDEQLLKLESDTLFEEWRSKRSSRLLEPQQCADLPVKSASTTSDSPRVFHVQRSRVRRDKAGNAIKRGKGSPESQSSLSK